MTVNSYCVDDKTQVSQITEFRYQTFYMKINPTNRNLWNDKC